MHPFSERVLILDDESTDHDSAAENANATSKRKLVLGTGCGAAGPKSLRRHFSLIVLATVLLVVTIAAVLVRHMLGGDGALSSQLEAGSVELKAGANCAMAFQQCGGVGFSGATCCAGSCTCGSSDGGGDYYKQCMPPNGLSTCDGPVAKATASAPAAALPPQSLTHCTGILGDCKSTRCCDSPDLRCYEKDPTWAMCNTSCVPGPDPKDGKPWSCKDLTSSPKTKVFEKRVKSCGWTWESCSKTNCCKIPGMGCYEKNPEYAVCMKTCTPGYDPREGPGAQPWACNKRPSPELVHLVSLDANAPAMGTSLFCFATHLANSYEELLLKVQRKLKLGIFACDEFHYMDKAQASKNGRRAMKDFTEFWMEIKGGGQYLRHDWTVKSDLDAVFIPARLRQNLAKMHIPQGTAVYIKKNPFWTGGDMLNIGAIQVLSKEALNVYFKNWWDCKGKLHDFGEDFYLRTCFDAYGIKFVEDSSLLNDLYSLGNKWQPINAYRCEEPGFVAFHPYQNITTWLECHKKAVGEDAIEEKGTNV